MLPIKLPGSASPPIRTACWLEEGDFHVFWATLSLVWNALLFCLFLLVSFTEIMRASWRSSPTKKQIISVEMSEYGTRSQKTGKSQEQHRSEMITAPIGVNFTSLLEKLSQSSQTSSLYRAEEKLFEIPWLVNTCCFYHPSCSLVFEMHSLSRPFPSAALSFPLSSSVPLQGGRARWVTKVSRLSCQHRFHVGCVRD